MKNSKFLFRLIGIMSLLLMVVSVLGADVLAQVPFLTPEIIAPLFGSGTGLTLAMAVVGTPGDQITIKETQDDRLVRDVSQKLTEHKPDAFRLDTALRKLESAPLKAKYAEWEEVGQFPRIATIDDTADIATGATLDIPFKNAGESKYFIPNDICRVVDVATGVDHANYTTTRLLVTAVDHANNEVTVKAYTSSGYGNAPAIPALAIGNALQLIRFGHAKSEKEGVGEPRSMKPVQYKNFIHTFEKYVSISKIRKQLQTYTEDDLKRGIRQAIYDMRLDMESVFWDGVGFEDAHPTNDEKMFGMKGVSEFITSNVISLPSVGSITETMFLDWAEQVADDSHGSEEKMLWVSAGLWTEINKIPLITETLQSRRSETKLGAKVYRIQGGHCEFLLGVHKGFKELGKTRFGAIIDPMHLRKRVLEPMHTVDINPEPSGGAREEGRKYIETCTVEVRYEKTHALLV